MVFGFGMAFFSYQKGGWSVYLFSLRWLKIVTLFGDWFGKLPPPPPSPSPTLKRNNHCPVHLVHWPPAQRAGLFWQCTSSNETRLGFGIPRASLLRWSGTLHEAELPEEEVWRGVTPSVRLYWRTVCFYNLLLFSPGGTFGWIKCFYFLETPKVTKEDYDFCDFCIHSRFNQGSFLGNTGFLNWPVCSYFVYNSIQK